MGEKIAIIKLFEPTPILAANIRTMLRHYDYIEVDNLFIVSYNKVDRSEIKTRLKQEEGLKYCFFHINLKAGNKVYINGLNEVDSETIKDIIEDQS